MQSGQPWLSHQLAALAGLVGEEAGGDGVGGEAAAGGHQALEVGGAECHGGGRHLEPLQQREQHAGTMQRGEGHVVCREGGSARNGRIRAQTGMLRCAENCL